VNNAGLRASLADRYTIERELGAGGMATVYLAHDLKHDRKVAIKVLHPDLAATIGVDRFLGEIKVTANLQHPNILSLFDSGVADGHAYYVMPFIEGESLRDRLTREKQLPVADALRIASGLAAALAYAHAQGVIHRDIKPENILLQSGQPVVADFGIALAVQQAGGARLTQTGMSLGTPQYMSPEQAMGERGLDARTDIYALGVVTYEMLAGEPPFTGPNAQAIVAQVLTAKPAPLTELRDTVPVDVDAAIARALQKLPADRFTSAAEFAAAMVPRAQTTVGRPQKGGAAIDRTRLTALVLGSALVGLAAGIFGFAPKHETLLTTGAIVHVTTDDGLEIQPAISPDGKTMAYAAGTSLHVRLFLRPVDGGPAVPLTRDSVSDQQEPQWSPSGNSLLFLAGGDVDTVAAGLGGGIAATIIKGGTESARPTGRTGVNTAAWSPDGKRIVFVRGDSVLIYTIASGEARAIAVGYPFKECAWSPRGDHIACTTPRDFAVATAKMGNTGPSTMFVIAATGDAPVAVSDSSALNTSPAWSPDGRRLYFVSNRDHQRDIYYVGIGSNGRAIGETHRLTTALNAASLSLSHDGKRLAYSVYTPQANIWSVPILPNGVATQAMATQVTFGHQLVESMQVTSDGKGLTYDADRNGNSDIWRLKFGEREAEALTSDVVDEFGGTLSPDGRRLAYYAYPGGTDKPAIMVKSMDGGGPVQRVNGAGNYGLWPEWMPDGKSLYWGCGGRICIATEAAAGGWHIDSSTAGPPLNWSPDGKWKTAFNRAGAAGTAGTDSVWLYPANTGAARLVYARRSPSDPLAMDLQWGPDSHTLYFRSGEPDGRAAFWSLSLNRGAPRLIARLDDLSHPSYRSDFSADGRRIYFTINDRQSDISVVELIER
jgi:serine/threonine-protein kinase